MTAAAQTEETTVTQSRIGKRPIPLPKGVDVKINGRTVSVRKGPKGELLTRPPEDHVTIEDGELVVLRQPRRQARSGRSRARPALLANMGTHTTGYALSLDLVGVGYRAELKGRELTLSLGLSHQIKYPLPASINARVETLDEGGIKRPRVHRDSCDKELLGQAAARIRSFRPPEPYKGKGVRYTGEKLREKAGKAGGKK